MGFKGIPKINVRQLSWSSISSLSTTSPDSNDPLIDPEKQQYSDSPTGSPIRSTFEQSHPQAGKSLLARCMHLLIWSTLAAFILWGIGALVYRTKKFETHLHTVQNKDGDTKVVHWFTTPDQPAAAFFSDSELNNKWTISIPPAQDFPLTPNQQMGICLQPHRIHHQLHMGDEHMGHPGYYQADPDYMQISEAIESGILPPASPPHASSVVEGIKEATNDGDSNNADPETGICKRSLTFVMQSADAGMGPTLMSLWLAYGMAKFEKRAFFIDDRNWAYGSWSTFFAPPPSPSCKPAPETHRVPCPHQADHLLVSTATSRWTFGHGFEDEFEDAHKMEVQRQIRIFDMIHEGYKALFHLASNDASYVAERMRTLNETIHPGLSIGIHIRHGDKHPYSPEFSKTYIPSSKYIAAANHELTSAFNITSSEAEAEAASKIAASKLILASDDASVYSYWDEADMTRAQDRIILSTPSSSTSSSGSATGSFATLQMPFDGGFFAAKFGEIKGSAAWFGTDPGLEHRALLARAYLMDLAVLGSMDRIVCTVSSVGCRLLAVMMGWDRAIVQGQWVNVDGDWDWQGVRW